MIISRLTLHNFGVYAGTNTFEFQNNRPIVLIGGMNGRGKTTFLEAVLLALYGTNSFAYLESKNQTYGQYLKSFVNTSDGTYVCFVELEFILNSGVEEKYLVRREWIGSGQRTREKISVKKNNESNMFYTDNWSMFIENILPSGLSNFFFFDGEKIAELAVENTNAQMKESIKLLLGISVLDMLESDVARIISAVGKSSHSQMESKELEVLREKKKQTENCLQIADEKINELMQQLENCKKKLEKTRSNYTAKGGDIIAQRQDLFRQRNLLTVQLSQIQERMIGIASGEMPLLLLELLLSQIYEQAEKEHEARVLDFAIQKIDSIFKIYSADKLDSDTHVLEFIDYVKHQSEKDFTERIYNLSDQTLYQLKDLITSRLNTVKSDVQGMMQLREQTQAKINELDSYLSVDIDENALSRIYKKIKLLEQESIDLEVEVEAMQKKRASLNGDFVKANTEYNRFVEELLEKLELNDDGDRIMKYSHQITTILAEFKIRLQAKKIGVLADTMTNCYKKLASKKNLIKRIEMDSVTLDFKYLDNKGNVVPKESLSAGEKQLMVISLLWALAICSKKKLPVIIDTPLSRLDSNHRSALIKTYFPHASDQTIILSTDSEINHYYYEMMKDNVGDEYTLVYDDEKKCSTIERGYFIGDQL